MKRAALALLILSIAGGASAQTFVIRASYSGSGQTTYVLWPAVTGAVTYHVRRTYAFPNNWTTITGVTNAGYAEWFNGPENTVVYQVLAMDASGVQIGPASNYAMVSKYAYAAPITAGQTIVAASHVTELRSIVTSVRASVGLGAPTWTYPTLTPGSTLIHGADIDDLRTAVNGITSLLGLPAPPYVQATPMAGKVIQKADIQQLRDVLRSYPEMYWPFPAALEPYFSPNGDGVKDTTTFRSDVSWNYGSTRTDFRWQIVIRNPANAVIRTATGTSPILRISNDNPRVIHDWIWDGKDGSGNVQPDGVYSYEIIDLDTISGPMPGSWGRTTVTLDTTPPAATISSPADPYTLSNVRLNGGGSVTVTGSASDAIALATWKLERTGNSQPAVQLGTGTTSVTNATLGTLSTITDNAPTIPNGAYQLTLTATDRAGNTASDNNAVTVAHFTASQNVYQINADANQTVTFTSAVPFAVNETIELRSAAGQTVRTVYTGSRAAGSYQDSWNGRNDASQTVGDGPYYMVAIVTEGSNSMTWDPRASYVGGQSITQLSYPQCLTPGSAWVACDDTSLVFDPFRVKPLMISYCVGSGTYPGCTPSSMPAWVIGKVTSVAETDASCNPACLFTEFQPGGAQRFDWFGTSTTGSYVAPYYLRLTVIRRHDQIPRNLVLVYGTTPVISNPRISPPIFNPGAGTATNGMQTFTVNVDTHNARQAQLKLQFRNMQTNSVLRTITTALAPEGDISAQWDGRADNNAWVAPGWYEVTISAIDSAGSATKIKPVVVVRY